MAIYHFQMKTVSRSEGRSATAAAAYRAGQKIEDTRTGQTFDYSKRTGVLLAEVIAPDGQPVDRAQLWNVAEAAEKRCNSVVAREFVVALPHELNQEQQAALVKGYAQGLSERTGWAVDVAIHAPGKAGDLRNTHAHLLCTTRTIERDPAGCPVAGSKTRAWDVRSSGSELLHSERAEWERCVNQSLELANRIERVDCRSHAERQTGLEPQVHLGPTAMAMERKGIQTERGDAHRRIRAYNTEVLSLQQVRAEKAQEESWSRELERLDTLPLAEHRKAVSALCPPTLAALISDHPEVKAAESSLAACRDSVGQWSASMAQQHREAEQVWERYDFYERFHPKQLKAAEQGLCVNPSIAGLLGRQNELTRWFEQHLEPYKAQLSELEKREAAIQALKKSLEPWAKAQQEAQFPRFDEAYSRLLNAEYRESLTELNRLRQISYGEMRKEVEALRRVPDVDTLKVAHPFVNQIPSGGPAPHHSDEQRRVWEADGAIRSAQRGREAWQENHPVQRFLHESGVKAAPGLKLRESQLEYLSLEAQRAKQALSRLERQHSDRDGEFHRACGRIFPSVINQQSQKEYFYTAAKEVLSERSQREPEQARQWEQQKAQERSRGGGRGWSL